MAANEYFRLHVRTLTSSKQTLLIVVAALVVTGVILVALYSFRTKLAISLLSCSTTVMCVRATCEHCELCAVAHDTHLWRLTFD